MMNLTLFGVVSILYNYTVVIHFLLLSPQEMLFAQNYETDIKCILSYNVKYNLDKSLSDGLK